MPDLMISRENNKIAREDLWSIPTPAPTVTHKPVPHIRIAEFTAHEAAKRGYDLKKEEYGVNPSGTKMFGLLKFHPEGHPEHTRALGIRNSHDKSMAVGLTAGMNVLVCDNMCFGGEAVIHRKHTSGLEIRDLIPRAFDELEIQFHRLENNIELLKAKMIDSRRAKVITVDAARKGVINSSDIVPVVDEFDDPRYEDFLPKTLWSLYNSFTENCKKYTPERADRCYRGLGAIFGLA